LIELIIVIIILGLLGAVAIPRYQDMTLDAKTNSCKADLGGMRTAIALWQVRQAVSGGAAAWPPYDSMATHGVVMSGRIPDNPFQLSSNAPDSVVQGVTRGVVVGTRGGWAYKASTGEIWANTNTTVGGSGCGGSQSVGENAW
jgi:type II secretory pathway pseudopilin PulG